MPVDGKKPWSKIMSDQLKRAWYDKVYEEEEDLMGQGKFTVPPPSGIGGTGGALASYGGLYPGEAARQAKMLGISEAEYLKHYYRQMHMASTSTMTPTPAQIAAQQAAYQQRMQEQQEAHERERQLMDSQGARKVWGNNPPVCSTCPLYHPNSATNGRCLDNLNKRDGAEVYASRTGCATHPRVAAIMDYYKEHALADHIAEKITGTPSP